MKEKTIENEKKAKHYRTNQIAKPEMMQKNTPKEKYNSHKH